MSGLCAKVIGRFAPWHSRYFKECLTAIGGGLLFYQSLNPNAKIQNSEQSSGKLFHHDPNQIPFNWVHLARSMPPTDKRVEAGKRLYFEPFVNYLDNLLLFLYRISIFRRKRIPEAKSRPQELTSYEPYTFPINVRTDYDQKMDRYSFLMVH
jgi:hypothetical protein